MTVPDATTNALGAYLLGSLEPAERAQVRAHLQGCQGCQQEVASLAGLPGLLGRLQRTEVERLTGPKPPADPSVLDRSLTELRHRRDARRHRRLLSVAAALVLSATVGAAVLTLGHSESGSGSVATPVTQTLSGADAKTGVAVRFDLTGQPWGTTIGVVLDRVPNGTHCVLVVVSRDGRRIVAGSWQGAYEGTTNIIAAADIAVEQVSSLEVDTNDGQRLVSVAA